MPIAPKVPTFNMAVNDVHIDQGLTIIVQGLDPNALQNVHYEMGNQVAQIQAEAARQIGVPHHTAAPCVAALAAQ